MAQKSLKTLMVNTPCPESHLRSGKTCRSKTKLSPSKQLPKTRWKQTWGKAFRKNLLRPASTSFSIQRSSSQTWRSTTPEPCRDQSFLSRILLKHRTRLWSSWTITTRILLTAYLMITMTLSFARMRDQMTLIYFLGTKTRMQTYKGLTRTKTSLRL